MIKTYPGFSSAKKFVIVNILNILAIVFSLLMDYFVPDINLNYTSLSSYPTETFQLIHEYMIFEITIIFVSAFSYFLFAYYLTKWFNNNFSSEHDKIKLFFYSVIIGSLSSLCLIIDYFLLYIISSNVLTNGIISFYDLTLYNQLLTISGLSFILGLIYMITEIIAFLKLFFRLTANQNGKYLHNKNESWHSQYNTQFSYADQPTLCSICGNKLENGAKFCGYCGTQVS